MKDARQLRLDSERAFRLARASSRKFFDELNGLGWNLQRQAQKSSAKPGKARSPAKKTTRMYI